MAWFAGTRRKIIAGTLAAGLTLGGLGGLRCYDDRQDLAMSQLASETLERPSVLEETVDEECHPCKERFENVRNMWLPPVQITGVDTDGAARTDDYRLPKGDCDDRLATPGASGEQVVYDLGQGPVRLNLPELNEEQRDLGMRIEIRGANADLWMDDFMITLDEYGQLTDGETYVVLTDGDAPCESYVIDPGFKLDGSPVAQPSDPVRHAPDEDGPADTEPGVPVLQPDEPGYEDVIIIDVPDEPESPDQLRPEEPVDPEDPGEQYDDRDVKRDGNGRDYGKVSFFNIGPQIGSLDNVVSETGGDWRILGLGDQWDVLGVEGSYEFFDPDTWTDLELGVAQMETSGGHGKLFSVGPAKALVSSASADVTEQYGDDGPITGRFAAGINHTQVDQNGHRTSADDYVSGSVLVHPLGITFGDFNEAFLGATVGGQLHAASSGGPLESGSADAGATVFGGKHFYKDGDWRGAVTGQLEYSQNVEGNSFYDDTANLEIGGHYSPEGSRFDLGVELGYTLQSLNPDRVHPNADIDDTVEQFTIALKPGWTNNTGNPDAQQAYDGPWVHVQPHVVDFSDSIENSVDEYAQCSDPQQIDDITGPYGMAFDPSSDGALLYEIHGTDISILGAIPGQMTDGVMDTRQPAQYCTVPAPDRAGISVELAPKFGNLIWH